MKWIVILLFLFSCNTIKTPIINSSPKYSIHDIYVLVSLAGENVKGKITKQATLEINLTKMEIMGVDGCNQFGGKISYHDATDMKLRFGDINATEMYCDEMSNKVGSSLYKVKKYRREGMLLKLLSDKEEVLLTYKKVD